jgi:hypothetical protein
MKRIVASVGLVAVGASGLQAAMLPGLTTESGKPWTLSATLRGFYDDNLNGVPSNYKGGPDFHRETSGFELSPSLEFSFPLEQTTLSFGYVYSYKYYENKPLNDAQHYDMTHDLHATLKHSFSERYSVSVRDSFVVGQEPDLLRAGSTYNTFQRISGSNLRNYGSMVFSAQMTPEFGIDVGYANTMLSYADNAMLTPAGTFQASTSGLSDYMDHVVHIDGRYQLMPQTVGVVGFQFRETDYTGNQPISLNPILWSDVRNARSYYGYAGLDHNFRPDLTGSFRAGGRYTEYYNDPKDQNEPAPYAMASLQYIYLPGSSVQIGSSYDYSATSQFSVQQGEGITLSAQSATVYIAVNHRITPKLNGTVMAQYQNSAYYGGAFDNKSDNFYTLGVNLQYRFTPNFSAEVGYNYDKLEGQVNPNYDRNRVYIGVTGSY